MPCCLFYSRLAFQRDPKTFERFIAFRVSSHILSAGLRFHSDLSGGLRLSNYRSVAGNHKFSPRFSVFACFCGGYSNRVKRPRTLSGNFILVKLLSLTKDCLFTIRYKHLEQSLCL